MAVSLTKKWTIFARTLSLLLFLVLIVSCSSVNRTLTNREFKKNGYRISTPKGIFVYEKDPLMRKLKIGYGYDQKTFIDNNGDNEVDRIEYRYEKYERGEEGTENAFKKADRLWKEKLKFLQVPEVHKKWKNMSASERLEERNY